MVFTDDSRAVLLHFFVRTSVILYVTFILSLFGPYLSFVWCFGEAVFRGSVISRVSAIILLNVLDSLIFLLVSLLIIEMYVIFT